MHASDLRKQSSKFLINFYIGHIILCRPAKIEVLTTLLPDTNTLSFSMLYVGLNDQITGGELAIIAISIAFASTVSNQLRP